MERYFYHPLIAGERTYVEVESSHLFIRCKHPQVVNSSVQLHFTLLTSGRSASMATLSPALPIVSPVWVSRSSQFLCSCSYICRQRGLLNSIDLRPANKRYSDCFFLSQRLNFELPDMCSLSVFANTIWVQEAFEPSPGSAWTSKIYPPDGTRSARHLPGRCAPPGLLILMDLLSVLDPDLDPLQRPSAVEIHILNARLPGPILRLGRTLTNRPSVRFPIWQPR